MQDKPSSQRELETLGFQRNALSANDNDASLTRTEEQSPAAHFHIEVEGRNFQFLVRDDQIADVIELFNGVETKAGRGRVAFRGGDAISLADHPTGQAFPMLAIVAVSALLIAAAYVFG